LRLNRAMPELIEIAQSALNHKRHKIAIVVAALIEDDRGRLLMVQEAKPECYGLWNQPAGHLDANESIVEALIREVKEETGYVNIRIDSIAGIHHFVDESILRINFKVSLLDQSKGPLADDVLEARWFSREEIEELRCAGQLRNRRTEIAIRDWLEGKSYSIELLQTHLSRMLE